ncbi:MAG: hypothetical protein M3401_17775 [Actinomycetota bacterium]|nr:hypothetical protein [Actinomycetota bacterium]
MKTRTKLGMAAAAAVVLAAGGVGVAVATNDDDASDKPITGSALKRASEAALEHSGGGEVTGTEIGDEESYYEVEVTRPGGSQTDVQLDRSFKVVGSENESGDED